MVLFLICLIIGCILFKVSTTYLCSDTSKKTQERENYASKSFQSRTYDSCSYKGNCLTDCTYRADCPYYSYK